MTLLCRCIGISSGAAGCDEKGDPNDDVNDTNICLVTMSVMLVAHTRTTDTFLCTRFLFVLSCNDTFLPKVTSLEFCFDEYLQGRQKSNSRKRCLGQCHDAFCLFCAVSPAASRFGACVSPFNNHPLTQLIYFYTSRQGYVKRQIISGLVSRGFTFVFTIQIFHVFGLQVVL